MASHPRTPNLTFLARGALTLSVLTAFTPHATAQRQCDGPLTAYDSLYCLQKVYMKADDDLNAVYGKLMAALPATAKATLRNAQRAWIARRDRDCVFEKDGWTFVSMDCATDLTVSRVNELSQRLRECTSSGCRVSQIR